MKTHTTTRRRAIASLAAFALSFAFLSFGASRAQAGNMQEALDLLERARHSEKEWHLEHALEHLEGAKHHLEDSGSKAPEREDAIHQIREAMESARHEDWRHLNEHIDRAIHLVREGLMGSPAPTPAPGGNMREALEMLEGAKHSEKEWHLERAIEKLEGAKHHLEESGSKAPERIEAIHQVREAIEDARSKEWHRMNEHIDRAIHLVREGTHE